MTELGGVRAYDKLTGTREHVGVRRRRHWYMRVHSHCRQDSKARECSLHSGRRNRRRARVSGARKLRHRATRDSEDLFLLLPL